MTQIWPCPTPLPNQFGLSPTWKICGCECSVCEEIGCKNCECDCKCGKIDFHLDCGALATSGQVTSAVVYSMAMRKRLPENSTEQGACLDRGGWWGNELIGGEEPGTLLWTLEYKPPTQDNANIAGAMIEGAFSKLTDAGVIDDVEVSADLDSCTGLICFDTIKIEPKKTEPESSHFAWLWQTEGCC